MTEMTELIEQAEKLKEEGNQYLAQHKYGLAAEKYTAAIDLNGNSAIYYSNRAQALIKLESYGLAIQDANEAIKIDPKYIKALYRRASANYALGKLKEALRDFKMVVQIKPKDPDAAQKMKACEKRIREDAFAKAMEFDGPDTSALAIDIASIVVESSYDGPRLPDPVTTSSTDKSDSSGSSSSSSNGLVISMQFVHDTIAHFKNQKLLHRKYVLQILLAVRDYFKTLPSLMRLSLPLVPKGSIISAAENKVNISATPSTTAVNGAGSTTSGSGSSDCDSDDEQEIGWFNVCGDTHGQYYDLCHIFQIGGFPSEHNPYLFNGDFVDRGSFSFETVFTLLAIKLACPGALYMQRGNHETKNMNKIYGFEGEVKHKYDDTVMNLFTEVFNWLPVATTIANKPLDAGIAWSDVPTKSIFVVHGGLSTNVPDPSPESTHKVGSITLSSIENIPRGREPPESGLMADLLWSDPQPLPGRSFSKRGVGYSFGSDYTHAFLATNNLELIVRSHEVKDEGYLVEHGGKCITIFSAPNYCDQMGNKGAFIRFFKDMKPHFTQYDAVPHPTIRPMQYAGASMFGL